MDYKIEICIILIIFISCGGSITAKESNQKIIEESQAILYATEYIEDTFLNDSETPFRYDIKNAVVTDVKFVHSMVKDINDYYIITFGKEFNGKKEPVLITTLDAKDGTFWSMTKGRVLDKKDIINCTKEYIKREFTNKSHYDIQEPELIFKISPISISDTFPLWQVNISLKNYENTSLFINQAGEIYTNVTINTAKKVYICHLKNNYISKEHAVYAALRDINVFEFRNKSDFMEYLENIRVQDVVLVNSLERHIPDYYVVSFTNDNNRTLMAFVDALNGWLMGLSKDTKIIHIEDLINCVKNNTDLIFKRKKHETRYNSSRNKILSKLVLKKRGNTPNFVPLWQINISNINEKLTLFIDQNGTVYNKDMVIISYMECGQNGYKTMINDENPGEIHEKKVNALSYYQLIPYILFIIIIISIIFLIVKKKIDK